MISSFSFLYYIVINVFIGGPLENQLVEGQPSLKELNMKYMKIRYANVVWGALSSTKLSTLQRYQDRAFDLIESSKIKDDYNKNILNVNQLMTFNRAVMTFKIVNQLCPESLQNKFIEMSALSKYNTRNMKDLHVQKLKLEHTKKSFLYTGPKAWNSIPQLIRDTESVVRFKKDLKSHLLS